MVGRMAEINIGIVGAGVIGSTHIRTIARTEGFRLVGIVDTSPHVREVAEREHVALYTGVDELIASRSTDGVIVATPNEHHVSVSIALLEAGIPVLLEKPIANTVAEAETLLRAAARTGVAFLVGHHRRHNPIVKAAKKGIAEGVIGKLVMASLTCSLYKNIDYFDVPWRSQPGVGGPLLINLIHEIDLMRHFFGDIETVSATSSNAIRRLPVEDTAALVLRFQDGGIASMSISDAAVGPWAWDISAGENPERFPVHPVQFCFMAGTEGGLSLPDLRLWSHAGEKSWTRALQSTVLSRSDEDPYCAQIRHFGEVITRKAEPLVSGVEATKNLATIDAIKRSAETGRETAVEPLRV